MFSFAKTIFEKLNRFFQNLLPRVFLLDRAGQTPFMHSFRTAIFLAVIATATSPVFSAEVQIIGTGTIVAGNVNVRRDASPSAPIVMVLNRGTKVRILKQERGWLYVSHNSKVGYIRNRRNYVRVLMLERTEITNDRKPVSSPADKKEKLQIESREIQQKLSEHRQEILVFTRKETALVESLDQIDQAINQARKQAAAIRSEIDSLDQKISQNVEESKKLEKRISQIEGYASRRLAALYKLSCLGRFNVLASADSMYDLFRRATALEKILFHDNALRQELSSNKERLELLKKDLQEEKNDKQALEVKKQTQINLMSQKRAERSQLLNDIRSKKSLELAVIDTLKQSAHALDHNIRLLNRAPLRIRKEEKKPTQRFDKLKGLLKIPVKGTIVAGSSAYAHDPLHVLNVRNGIRIQADRGEPIRAVCTGRVIYADWFKGYGNMIIIDHGNSYYTVYAHVEDLFKSKGDQVESDEVIATAGDTGSLMGSGLYFEVRHHGKALNPMDWIKKG